MSPACSHPNGRPIFSGSAGDALADLPESLAQLLEEWAASPAAHSHVGDWRRVGYARGVRAPEPADPRVTRATWFGIRPGHETDSSVAIQDALDRIGAEGGGVLLLQRGRYVLDNPLFIHDDNVVLRGAEDGDTILHFTRPLALSIGEALWSGDSAWSWNGGQVFFISRERLAESQRTGWSYAGGLGKEGWLPGEHLASVAPAARGAEVLTVDDSSRIPVGSMVMLEIANLEDHRLLQEMAGNVAGAEDYDWRARAPRISAPPILDDFETWQWPVRVVDAPTPTTIRIEQPLRLEVLTETPTAIRELGPTVHDSGVEDLTIENALIVQTTHNVNPGSNGVAFQAVHDCWARNIRVVNADLAFGLTASKSCTLSGITASGRSLHHFVACRTMSHDNLVEDFLLEDFTVPAVEGSYLHGINLEGLSSGNVYRRGTMRTGTFDSHRQMPFENLRSDITVTNKDAVPGGSPDAGPFFGARTVHWGITVTNGNNLCMEITDIAPKSVTAGIVGLADRGSILPRISQDFPGDLQSQCLAFGTGLGQRGDLLELQRAILPPS